MQRFEPCLSTNTEAHPDSSPFPLNIGIVVDHGCRNLSEEASPRTSNAPGRTTQARLIAFPRNAKGPPFDDAERLLRALSPSLKLRVLR